MKYTPGILSETYIGSLKSYTRRTTKQQEYIIQQDGHFCAVNLKIKNNKAKKMNYFILLPVQRMICSGRIPFYFPVITCAVTYAGVLLRTSQSALILFNSFYCVRKFFNVQKLSEPFPKYFEHFRRFKKKRKNILNGFEPFLNFSKDFRALPIISASLSFRQRFRHVIKVVMECFLVGYREKCHSEYILRIQTHPNARVYTEKTSDACHIRRYPTRKHCI